MGNSYQVDDLGIAEIVMDNPPVNALTVAGWFEVAELVAEARKFGLRMTLANQNLSQLPGTLAEALLGNAAQRQHNRTRREQRLHFVDESVGSVTVAHSTDSWRSPPFITRKKL